MWSDLIQVKIQEWPDASGVDDHGRDASHESAHTSKQHEKAADYHNKRADMFQKQADQHKANSEAKGYDREESIKQARASDSADKHREAAREHTLAKENPKAERYMQSGKSTQTVAARHASYVAHRSEEKLREPILPRPRYAGF